MPHQAAPGLGLWKADRRRLGDAVRTALHLGYRHFDAAPVYGNQRELGAALQASGILRQEITITTKLWNNSHRAERVRPSLEANLAELGLQYVDACLIHWPVLYQDGVTAARQAGDFLPPDAIPLEETWAALEECVQAGLARHLGVCNFSLSRLQKLQQIATIKPKIVQVELHPYLPQEPLRLWCQAKGIRLEAACPLGSGDRPPALKQANEPRLLADPVVKKIAHRHQATPAQILISWALGRGTIPLPKAISPRHLRENWAAQHFILNAEDLAALSGLACGFRYLPGTHAGSPYTLDWLWN